MKHTMIADFVITHEGCTVSAQYQIDYTGLHLWPSSVTDVVNLFKSHVVSWENASNLDWDLLAGEQSLHCHLQE